MIGDYERIKTKDRYVMDLLKSAGDNILFTGVLSNNKLYDIVSQALALVLPTHYEGFGIPPLESLYLGGNAIITDLPVLREVYSELPVVFFKDGDIKALADWLVVRPQLNICYCHSPIRYVWDMYHEYLEISHLSKGLKGMDYSVFIASCAYLGCFVIPAS